MNAVPAKLETYLAELDRALSRIAISDRAEIITEIKSHVLEALDRDPSKGVDSVLASLGEPETVANRYLLERGMKPLPPPRRPIVKWLVIGVLGMFGIAVLGLLVLVWAFSPLIKVDDKAGRVVLLGGLIDVNDKDGTFRVGNVHGLSDKDTIRIEGDTPLGTGATLNFSFTNGKITAETSHDDRAHWDCLIPRDQDRGNFTQKGKNFEIDLSKVQGSKCEVEMPIGRKLVMKGGNAKLDLVDPRFDIDAEIANGKVDVSPESDWAYEFDTHVMNGKSDNFRSTTELHSPEQKKATKVAIRLTNGVISNEADE